jgi:prepilin-type N-terminal cleavage/methylation domain-containing protein
MTHLKQKQAGFTLVEIAIVLVIIGLLLGAVFKGQELIAQTQIKNVVKKFDEIRAATYTYLDKYNALPGDDGNNNDPTTDFTGNTNDGIIESPQFWDQLHEAGLIEGSGETAPTTPWGTSFAVANGKADFSGNVLCALVPGDVAQQIDNKYDDGDGTKGSYRSGGTGDAPGDNADYDTTKNNWVCTKL